MKTGNNWPELFYEEGKETYQTVHLWTQIAGKILLARMPWVNHSWHVTFRVTPYGLTTGNIPDREQHFQINFNFLEHRLEILTSRGKNSSFKLAKLSVAAFYEKIFTCLKDLGINIRINPIPNEMANSIPLHKDRQHATYNPEAIAGLHGALLNSHEILNIFRSEFIGKCSPVHIFWGGFDMAVSRFSGRNAPPHPGGIPNLPDWVAREAYSHEVSSCGFWPGNEAVPFAAYYSYIYPEPAGFKEAPVEPESAYYHNELAEFILPYKNVQESADPSKTLLDFLQSTYNTAADMAHWVRQDLEKQTRKSHITE